MYSECFVNYVLKQNLLQEEKQAKKYSYKKIMFAQNPIAYLCAKMLEGNKYAHALVLSGK